MNRAYWKIFYIIWTPIRLIATFLWLTEWIPLGRLGPYVLGASICRWPERAPALVRADRSRR